MEAVPLARRARATPRAPDARPTRHRASLVTLPLLRDERVLQLPRVLVVERGRFVPNAGRTAHTNLAEVLPRRDFERVQPGSQELHWVIVRHESESESLESDERTPPAPRLARAQVPVLRGVDVAMEPAVHAANVRFNEIGWESKNRVEDLATMDVVASLTIGQGDTTTDVIKGMWLQSDHLPIDVASQRQHPVICFHESNVEPAEKHDTAVERPRSSDDVAPAEGSCYQRRDLELVRITLDQRAVADNQPDHDRAGERVVEVPRSVAKARFDGQLD